jgi:hypothetical protein
LKYTGPIEGVAAKIGFARYFHTLKKNLASEPGFFKKRRLREPGRGEIGPFEKFRLSESLQPTNLAP